MPSVPKRVPKKPNHSQSKKTPVKDVKGKGKLVSDSEDQAKKMTTNPRKDKRENVKNQHKEKQTDSNKTNNKIKVFTIKRKDETNLIKRMYLVDPSITFHCSVKGSQGPKQLWVPKSA